MILWLLLILALPALVTVGLGIFCVVVIGGLSDDAIDDGDGLGWNVVREIDREKKGKAA